MSNKITGNIKGLAKSQIAKIEKLYSRKIEKSEIIPLDLAKEIYQIAAENRRIIGLLIDREGKITDVFVGTKEIIYLPDVGRYRAGAGRLRHLRLVYTDLNFKDAMVKIPSDIYGDLEKLRLDAVVGIKEVKNKITFTYAYNLPVGKESDPAVKTVMVKDLAEFDVDFWQFLDKLEDDIINGLPSGGKETIKNGAFLVGVYDRSVKNSAESMRELKELARTAGVTILGEAIQMRTPDSKTVLGKGKLEEITLQCLRLGAEILIFDCELKPSQWLTLVNSTELKIIDRSMLILDIFATRASSSEGRLQVELAQLKYNLRRLVEKSAGLSRLSGGIGGRGPGETKLEIGSRRIRDRIVLVEQRIDKLASQRALQRSRREVDGIPVVSVLGYTNVGKSTLFNRITKSEVFVENKLFATLETTQRKVVLPALTKEDKFVNCEFVISDTVGFIRDLPQELYNAFRATLEELYQASLLIHVVDASDPAVLDRKRAVDKVLEDMELLDRPTLLILNKCDLVDEDKLQVVKDELGGDILVSAKSGQGIDELLQGICNNLYSGYKLSINSDKK